MNPTTRNDPAADAFAARLTEWAITLEDSERMLLGEILAAATTSEVEAFGFNAVRATAIAAAMTAAAGLGVGTGAATGHTSHHLHATRRTVSAGAPAANVPSPAPPAIAATPAPPASPPAPTTAPVTDAVQARRMPPPPRSVERTEVREVRTVENRSPVSTTTSTTRPHGDPAQPATETVAAPARSANGCFFTYQSDGQSGAGSASSADNIDQKVEFTVSARMVGSDTAALGATFQNTTDHAIRFEPNEKVFAQIDHDGSTVDVDLGEVGGRQLAPGQTLTFEANYSPPSHGQYNVVGRSARWSGPDPAPRSP